MSPKKYGHQTIGISSRVKRETRPLLLPILLRYDRLDHEKANATKIPPEYFALLQPGSPRYPAHD
jgi:hypothetical protein